MKALVFNQKGPAEQVLEYRETAISPLQPDEVSVKVLASPINPADFMFIEKTYRVVPVFPQIAGFEGTGVITDNGGDERYPVNSLVAFHHKNVWAEQVNVPKDKIISLPQDMPLEKAAQMALNPLTAWALLEESEAVAGEWIVLSAANSALCKLMVQLANKRGIKTLAILRKSDDSAPLLQLGVSAVVHDDAADLEAQLLSHANGDRIAAFLDAVGGELVSKVIKALSGNGRIIHYGLYSEQSVTYHNADVIFKNLTIKGFGIDRWSQSKTAEELKQVWNELISQIIAPDFQLEVSNKFPLSEYPSALSQSKLAKGGKVLFWMEHR